MHLTRPATPLGTGRVDAAGPAGLPADEPLRLLVQRHNLRDTCLVADADAHAALAAGQARLRIDQFALTANNVTYAALGEAMRYWQFFPTPRARFGCVPVWGFATVVESRAAGVLEGQRCFGFWPMSSHHIAQVQQVDENGYVEAAPHRLELAATYNQVAFCAAESGPAAWHEPLQALLRPQFVTSFLIDDFLAEHEYFGARQVLISSASSKTAYGLALCLAGRRTHGQAGVRVSGLTAAANVGFARGLGCYDRLHCYDDLHDLDPAVPTVYIDLSGSAVQQLAVHHHFRGALSYSCTVGGTPRDGPGPVGGVPGPGPTLFLAPPQWRRRSGPPPESWGADGLQHRLQAAWQRVLGALGSSRSLSLQVQRGHGATAIRDVWAALVDGRADPRSGHMLSFGAPDSGPYAAGGQVNAQAATESAETVDTSH